MTDFITIFNTLSQKISFSLVNGNAVARQGGKKLKPDVLDAFLQGAGWSEGVDAFMEMVTARLKNDASHEDARTDSTRTRLESPLFHGRQKLTPTDFALLKGLRLCRSSAEDSPLLLLYTGYADIETFAPCPSPKGAGLAASIRDALCGVEMDGVPALEYYTGGIINILRQLTAFVQGQEPAQDIGIKVLAEKCPTLLLRSPKLTFWSHTETVGGKSHRVADGFSFDGDWADLIEDNFDYLLAEKSLRIKPPKIMTNSLNDPAFKYIDLNALVDVEDKPTPSWDAWCRRMTEDEADVFKAFVWSVFDANNSGRQMLYIIDEGYSGKSKVLEAIASCLGKDLTRALNKDSLNNQFGMSKVWNRRLVFIGDVKSKTLIRSQAMHSITGGDPVDVEYKGKNSFSYKPSCKVIAAGNINLEIDVKARNEATRVLPIAVNFTIEQMVQEGIVALDADGKPLFDANGTPKFVGDGGWGKRLKEEFWSFLKKCREPYERLCPTGTDIIIPDVCAETLASFDEDSADFYEDIITKVLTITKDESDYVKSLDLQKRVVDAISRESVSGLDFAGFKEFLRRRYNLTSKQFRIGGGERVSGFKGVKLIEADSVFGF